jgi:ATP-dependent Clp protease protease subunit
VQGTSSDIEIQAREFLRMRELMNEILVRHTGQPLERIERDADRNFWMSPGEAKDYGLLDEIFAARERKARAVAG